MKYRITSCMFWLITTAAVILRIGLKRLVINPATGFYDGSPLFVTIFNCVLGIGLVLIVLSALLTDERDDFPVTRGSRLLELVAVLLGVTILSVSGIQAQQFFRSFMAGSVIDIMGVIFMLLGFITGIVFIYIGVSYISGSTRGKLNGFVALIPILWQLYHLVHTFINSNLVATVSEQMLTVLTMTFNLLFLLAHARTTASIDMCKGRKQSVAYGYGAALCGFTLTIGQIGLLTGIDSISFSIFTPQIICLFMFSLYQVLYASNIYKDHRYKRISGQVVQ